MTASDLLPKNEDTLLACAFIGDTQKRSDVLALFAFLETLREVPERVSEPLMGEIRLRWWYEAIEEIADGKTPRYHPLTGTFQHIIPQYNLATADFLDLIEGQMPLLDKGALTIADALPVVDRGEGRVMALAARILGQDTGMTAVARLAGMAHIKASRGLSDGGDAELAHLVREARAEFKTLPEAVLPIALPTVLSPARWQGRDAGPLSKRLKLLAAYLTGRF